MRIGRALPIRPAGSMADIKVKRKRRDQLPAFLFLLPALIIFAVFVWYPMVIGLSYSFQKVQLAGESTWVGLDNYRRMLGDPLFAQAWRNVTGFLLLSLAFGYAVPIMLALMMNEMRRLGGLFQMIYYLPTLIPVTIALLVWRQIYAPEGGILNNFLVKLGMEPRLWLQDPSLAKVAMIIIMTWAGAGGSVLIYLAALKEVPLELYEAAELEGFTPWQRARHIAMPSMATKMQIMLVLQVIFVVQVFAEPMLLTEGGPANTTITPVLASYRAAFSLNDYGLASAWSVSLLLVLAVFSLISVWLSNRNSEAR
jgi:multiple sugar transport system permease protein